jgi:transcriptional regulator with XRE-family HTH domain
MGAMPAKRRPKSPSAIDVAVGRNLRVWRMAKGLSQSQLANRLGVTFQQVQKYEIGANRIGTGRLVKSAGILGVPISALFEGTDGAEPSRSSLALLNDSRSFRLAHAFAAIRSNKFRESLVALVEKLAALPQKPKLGRR